MKITQALSGLSATRWAKCCPTSGAHSSPEKLLTKSLLWLLHVGLFGLMAGCTLLRFGRGGAGKASAQPRLVEEQTQLQRFADDFLARGAQGLDQSAERLGTDAGREQVLRIKLVLDSSVLSIVSGPNPNANLLDLVSVTVLTRLSIQDYWMHTTNGAAFQLWLDASRVLETNVWDLAARFLQPAQVAELRAGIKEWYARTPEVRTAFFARPHAFAALVWAAQQGEAPKGSVFRLINLDPIAGLDPAVREVTQSRLFAERAMYTTLYCAADAFLPPPPERVICLRGDGTTQRSTGSQQLHRPNPHVSSGFRGEAKNRAHRTFPRKMVPYLRIWEARSSGAALCSYSREQSVPPGAPCPGVRPA